MKVRTAIVTLCAAALCSVGIAATASAETSTPAGGVWNYGTGGGWVWSDYFHPSKCHGSSVQGKWFDSDTASAGRWSEAQAEDRWYAVDRSWYKSYC